MIKQNVLIQRYRAFLFDMDGTLLNSIAAAERVWGIWAAEHGLDVQKFMPTMHGSRSADTIARLKLPGVDPEVEALKITRAEIEDVAGIVEIEGAAAFLRTLPPHQWAIVTSATRALATRRLEAVGLPQPTVLVTSEDVSTGKPNPEGYLLAARKLGVEARDCLIFEDAPVGIKAAEDSGAQVMVVTATHQHAMATSHSTILNYQALVLRDVTDGWLTAESTE